MEQVLELIPCPFCGGQAYYAEGMGCVRGMCDVCKLSTDFYDTKEEVATAWNRRPEPKTNFEAMLRKLKPVVCHIFEGCIEIYEGIEFCEKHTKDICHKSDDYGCYDCFILWANAPYKGGVL
jgi:Lar family restriction alleviation protein